MRLLTLKTVLVAVDLGEASRPPLRTAARLAQLAGASLHLLHVAGKQGRDGDTRLGDEFRLATPDAAEPDSVRVLPGSPADVIVNHAIALEADVVILGPHRGRGTTEALGSTAASVVRAAPCPCLVAATELRLPLERILAAIDVSDGSSTSLSVALSWASALRPRGGNTDMAALHVSPTEPGRLVLDAVRGEVEAIRARAGGAARVDIREVIVQGSDPAEAILREAVSTSADLLVMGSRGKDHASSGLGSVSAAVSRATPCPLLLVPPGVGHQRA